MKTRAKIIAAARRQRAEIEQYFTDAAFWNEFRRKPEDEPINPDPDGRVRQLADALDEMLRIDAAEGSTGRIAAPSLSMMFPKGPKAVQ